MKDVKQLVPIQHFETLLSRLESMNTNFISHWREEAKALAASVAEIPQDQVELANQLDDARIMRQVLQNLQDYYPQFCARGDAGKWISRGLGQNKEPVYPPETLLEIVTDENCSLRRQIEGLEKKLQSKQTELEDSVDQLCDFDRKFEEIRYLLGAVEGHEVACLRNTLEARTNEVAELKKKLDVATKALIEVKLLNQPGEGIE